MPTLTSAALTGIAMPEGVTFQYTAARTTYRGTTKPNLEATWQKERALAAAEMSKIVDATSEKLAAVRERAAEFEQAGEEAAAKAWHTLADRLSEI